MEGAETLRCWTAIPLTEDPGGMGEIHRSFRSFSRKTAGMCVASILRNAWLLDSDLLPGTAERATPRPFCKFLPERAGFFFMFLSMQAICLPLATARFVAETPDAYLAKAADLGEPHEIHSRDKKAVAERLVDAVAESEKLGILPSKTN